MNARDLSSLMLFCWGREIFLANVTFQYGFSKKFQQFQMSKSEPRQSTLRGTIGGNPSIKSRVSVHLACNTTTKHANLLRQF